MGNQISTANLKRVPKCMHVDGTSCRCLGKGELPPRGDPLALTKDPEFTLEQLRDQTSVPVVTIDISKPLPRFKLNSFHRKITKKVMREATQFIQGSKPILPQRNSLACIGLFGYLDSGGKNPILIKVCFEMKSLYIKGVIVEERFYELRKSDGATRLVQGSIALEIGETYLDMFGRDSPPVDLSGKALVNAFWRLVALARNAQPKTFIEAARCLGMLSLMLIEPCRQNDVKDRLCIGDQTSTEYYTMDHTCWEAIRLWDDRSKIAKGIEYDKDQTIVEKIYEPKDVFKVVQQLNIVNSTKVLPIKKIAGPRHGAP